MRITRLAATLLGSVFAVSAAAAQQTEHEQSKPPWSMAQAWYGKEAMESARKTLQKAHGSTRVLLARIDRLESRLASPEDALIWDLKGWYGGDTHKFRLRIEGEYAYAEQKLQEMEFKGLWSRAIDRYFDLQFGLRQDIAPLNTTYAVFGIQGLSIYWFELDTQLFISQRGEVTARLEAEYDLLFTQRLIAQARMELNLSMQDMPDLDTGAGVSDMEIGVRLRYEISRRFAPYIGVEWESSFDKSAEYARSANESVSKFAVLIGFKGWY